MQKRELNIDFLRVIAIIGTIIIHVSNIYVYSFNRISNLEYLFSISFNLLARICVPLFFMISGAFLINETFDFKKYKKRIIKYLIILIIWSIIYYFFNNTNYDNIISDLFSSLFNSNKTSRHLWYMYALLGLYIALPFVSNMCKNLTRQQENLFIILWLIFSGLDIFYAPLGKLFIGDYFKVTYPIPIINSTYYLGYFVIGYILHNRFKDKKIDKKHNIYLILTYLLSNIIPIIITYFISIKTNNVYESMFWYRSIFIAIASFSIFSLVILNKDKFNNNKLINISNYTFGIYLIHMIFIEVIKEQFNLIQYSSIYMIPLVTIIVFGLSLVSCFVLKKIPLIRNIL